MTQPRYVTTGHGQVGLVEVGSGPAVVVLAGPTRSAASVADQVADLLPRHRVLVVELPGTGGSAHVGGGLDESGAVVVEALGFLDGGAVALVALDLAAALAPAVAAGLGAPVTVLVDLASARGWAEHTPVPPDLTSTDDGTHLVALWSFLRDRRLLQPDRPHLPRTTGDPLPDVAELSAGFVAAATAPEAWRRTWQALVAGLGGAGAGAAGAVEVASLADLPAALPEVPAAGAAAAAPVPPTAPAPGHRLWLQHVDTARGRAHLRRAGSSGRPVMVLPTGGGSSAQFAPVVQGLGETRTAVAPDWFGNGLSQPLERTPTVADLADEAFAVADALGWDDFDLWGSHTGACTALEMAVSRPERIGRAVLEAPVVISEEFRADLQAHYFPDLRPDAAGTHVLRAWHWRREVFAWWPWYRVTHDAARAIGLPGADDLQLYAVGILQSGATYDGAYRAAFDFDTRARLPHLTRPALLTAGPHDMLANALDDAADLVPDGLLRTVPTPATVWWPDPDPVAAAATMQVYREFLDG